MASNRATRSSKWEDKVFCSSEGSDAIEGPSSSQIQLESFRAHRMLDRRQSQCKLWRGPRWGPYQNCSVGPPGYRSSSSASGVAHTSPARFAKSNPPQTWRHEDSGIRDSYCFSHPYRRNIRGARPSGHFSPLREGDQESTERQFNQKAANAEYRKPGDLPSSRGKPSCIHRDRLDVSCSTTRSNSGSRCESRCNEEVQGVPTGNLKSDEEVVPKFEGKNGPVALMLKERENGSEPCQTLAVNATANDAGAQAAADISEMTEAEVRVYALQMQALTQVLLRNMKCLYCTARAEIDRKDQRIAAQEREITLLKSLPMKHRGIS